MRIESFCANNATNLGRNSSTLVALMAQIRRKIGTYLRKIRINNKIPLDQVVAELSLMNIECSKSALSRLERDMISCRADILAGLCEIYKIDPRNVLYRNYIG